LYKTGAKTLEEIQTPVQVFKFGGSSVATADRIQRVVELVLSEAPGGRRVVVTSAMGGITDRLLEALDAALDRTDAHQDIIAELLAKHEAVVEAVALPEDRSALLAAMAPRWVTLGELLDGVYLLRECTPRTRDAILGMGERLAAPLLAAAFRFAGVDAAPHEATAFVRTDDSFGEAKVQFAETQALCRPYFDALPPDQIAIVTGFIAATNRGVRTTLGRSGSDYTATILAGAMKADRVVIWTDVDGVMSSDPRLVPETFTLPSLSYREAAEMAYFGAKVLHPRTMCPLIEQNIPLQIGNTLNPTADGTLITSASTATEGRVKAVSAIGDLAVVMIEGTGLAGVPGISARTFNALAAKEANVLLIAQASSEQSICMVVQSEDANGAVEALEQAFERETERREVSRVYALHNCAIVSVVGDFMRMQPGLAGRMFSTLGRGNINVLAIAQGASETNISAVIQGVDVQHAVCALHATFAEAHDRVHLCLIGPGGVGSALLGILERQAPSMISTRRIDLRLVGVANSRLIIWDDKGIPFPEAADYLERKGVQSSLDDLVHLLIESHLERLIVIDATASGEVATRYAELLSHGIAVVTPNKRANSGAQDMYDRLQRLSSRRKVPYLYETTVGAALPVLSTLRNLRDTGDHIEKIEGVLSGTLSFVFNQMAEGYSFSESVSLARDKGFSEPDPREDLGGEDVARKVLILAREAGLNVAHSDLEVDSIVPIELQDLPIKTFMNRLSEADDEWRARLSAGKRLHYVAEVRNDCFCVGVRVVAPESPLAGLRGTDNMVIFTTARYSDRPLVVQGRGADPEVTAAGVFADIIRAARAMG